jgi:hypothetical protein
MTKTLNQIIFFSSTKIRIFFSATLGIRIFFLEKYHNPFSRSQNRARKQMSFSRIAKIEQKNRSDSRIAENEKENQRALEG